MSLQVFIGMDSRQPLAYTVLQSSIIARSSVPVSINPLLIWQLPVTRQGLTEFTFTRYLPPWLCNYEGWSLFLDADMIVRGDIKELFDMADDRYAVMVVKNRQRFEWPSLMLFNNAKCQALTPEYIQTGEPNLLQWGEVGELPKEWNHCVGYDAPNPEAKLVHYTMGIPCFEEVKALEHGDSWKQELQSAVSTVPWDAIMGKSIHAQVLRSGQAVTA